MRLSASLMIVVCSMTLLMQAQDDSESALRSKIVALEKAWNQAYKAGDVRALDSILDNDIVLINDDVAVEDSSYTTGRRGVAGTVIVEKLVGSMAESGASLEQCKAFGDRINKRTASMGVAFTSCVVPAAGTRTFKIGDDEIEVGVGIHGEPGRRRAKMAPADTIVAENGKEYASDAVYVTVAYNKLRSADDVELTTVQKTLVTNTFAILGIESAIGTLITLKVPADQMRKFLPPQALGELAAWQAKVEPPADNDDN